ncbi:MAG TPA: bifunctional (p)ppGpp synthetase/guanosine-3',5'-bis(diphosphate) 3'-pyrophosphohydrolase [Pseudomonadales bacterium]|nr:bifunctional (p)ppGpp synthetase/guanosine-3',5'-bis(diphosphate) 3'-pyrophosphohydrolase [Pseudomonadales bacterium]
MVKVRQDRPVAHDGSVDLRLWVETLATRLPLADPQRIMRACERARQAELDAIAADEIWASGISSFETGLEMADILAGLRVDEDGLVAAILYRAVREQKLGLQEVETAFGPEVARIIEGVLRMAAVSALKLSGVPKVIGDADEQIENIRKMLVALVDDVRVALIKLAERLCAIRAVKEARAERRERVAREVFNVYAPLAHRLGIGQVRWELEDLSFRYLEPEAYKRIASLLKERWEARQSFVDEVVLSLGKTLDASGIESTISGRPKHIYSIWRKMQQKGIGFDQVYDVHAVRILVRELKDCYGALGVVHTMWRHIPHEFDDYIAMPKENGYRSIHTAVIGPGGRTLEVQIRTREMHEEAELGVCAHWAYKGTDRAMDAAYDQKVSWLRQVLEWQEELGDLSGLTEALRRDFSQERIYVLTPDGHVLDLAPGATPVDYAYRIHTEIGHRCRAARVDGRVVPLSHTLRTGEKIEIVTDDSAQPSRAWLNPNLGFVRTSRARAKIQAFFRDRDRERNLVDGREQVLRELERLGIDAGLLPRVALSLSRSGVDDLFAAIGSAEVPVEALIQALQALAAQPRDSTQLDLIPSPQLASPAVARPAIQGAGNLPVWIADCCTPEAGDPIVGRVTMGHGVTVHRSDCARALALERSEEARLIQLRWGSVSGVSYPFDLVITAFNRPGLLHEVSSVFAAEQVDVTGSSSRTDRETSTAVIEVSVELDGFESLARMMDRIGQIPNVLDVRRAGRGP